MPDIDVKKAVQSAKEYLKEAYADDTLRNLLLEEVQRDDNGDWLITLGFDKPNLNVLQMMRTYEEQRIFKIFHIDSSTGKVKSMKIRELCLPR